MIRDRLRAEQEEADERAITQPDQHDTTKPAEERNLSADYAKFYTAFIKTGGRLPRKSIDKFFELREAMENHFEAKGFKPTVIIVDEGGQSSVGGLPIPLTKFTAWEALFVAGDHKQLRPLNIAKDDSEVAETTVISPLERLITFKVDSLFLNPQYRMAPSMMEFPSKEFYDGRLETHADALRDNEVRQRVRTTGHKYYGIQSPRGSEYWWIDPYYGESHPEEGGYSLQNFANADVIDQLLENLIKEGIEPEDIVIISMYKAQLRLVYSRVTLIDGKLKFSEASTTDAFQGATAICVGIAKERLANDVQVHVIAQLRETRDNLLLVKGPPGIGKTRMIAYMIWVLVYFGKKVVAAAPSNKAADNLATTVRNNRPEWARNLEALMIRLATTSTYQAETLDGSIPILIRDFEAFTQTLCKEKDRINEVLRAFVDFYISVIAREPNQ
ncbi:MAG: hypothetical protein L6R42_000833 [Xanthoria sp. 1 TBL-2021]|nr:MAG: hypothetical protein L6R42_000833 [Xanthoria sp. 1 TBL-2021]